MGTVYKWIHGWQNVVVDGVNVWQHYHFDQLLPSDPNWLEFQKEDREDDAGAKAIEKWLEIVQIASESGDESLLSEDTIDSDDEEGFDFARHLVSALQHGLQELLLAPSTECFLISGSLTFDSHRVATKLQFVRAIQQLISSEVHFKLVPSFFGGVEAVAKEESDAFAHYSWEKSLGKYKGKTRPSPKPTKKAGEAGSVGYTCYEVEPFLNMLEVTPGDPVLDLPTDPFTSTLDSALLVNKIKRIEICWIDGDETTEEALGHIEVLCFQ